MTEGLKERDKSLKKGEKKPRLLSGMQPSGSLHLGNYMGALKTWVSLLDDYDCFFCIVDYHAITVPYEPGLLQKRIFDAAVDYLAAGLDPERCSIFIQSDVQEHMELSWIFNTITPLGQLLRMTQFKQKVQQLAKLDGLSEEELGEDWSQSIPLRAIGKINAGLLNYPVLQAADILLYKAEVVPVGEDQVQHIELTRDIARRFNHRFGELFPLCKPLLSQAPRIIGLDGKNKMSKSLGNHIPLSMEPEEVVEKVTRQAVSDPRRKRRKDPGVPEECNIYAWHEIFSSPEEVAWAAEGCRTAKIGCFECKKRVADNINTLLEPIRERRKEILRQKGYVEEVLREGAERAREIARATLEEVRELIGVRPHNFG